MCQFVTESQAAANHHYRDCHPPLKCLSCDQMFTNPSSLWRHKYNHLESDHNCRTCGKNFPFKSETFFRKCAMGTNQDSYNKQIKGHKHRTDIVNYLLYWMGINTFSKLSNFKWTNRLKVRFLFLLVYSRIL